VKHQVLDRKSIWPVKSLPKVCLTTLPNLEKVINTKVENSSSSCGRCGALVLLLQIVVKIVVNVVCY